MLDAKVAGEAITAPEPAAEAPIADLLEALKQSVAAAKKTGDEPAKPARSRTRAAARKSG
jgi:non-homologous end joining protein Ku